MIDEKTIQRDFLWPLESFIGYDPHDQMYVRVKESKVLIQEKSFEKFEHEAGKTFYGDYKKLEEDSKISQIKHDRKHKTISTGLVR